MWQLLWHSGGPIVHQGKAAAYLAEYVNFFLRFTLLAFRLSLLIFCRNLSKPFPFPAPHSLTLRSLTPARACWALPSLQLPGCAVLDCPFLQPQSMTLAQVAFGLLPTWPLHLQRLSGYGELQLARLATLLLAHHGGNQVVVFSSGSWQIAFFLMASYVGSRCSWCRLLARGWGKF